VSTGSPDGLRKQVWVGSIVVRCRRFDEMLAFWQAALGYVPQAPPEEGWVILTDPTGRGPNLSLDRVEQPPPLGEVSRVHLDLYTDDGVGEVERLLDWAQAATSGKPGRKTTSWSSSTRTATASASSIRPPVRL
jgi:Glyoxalase-like domain